MLGRWLTVIAACAPALHARIDLLLVPPPGPVARDQPLLLTLHLHNPTDRPDRFILPPRLAAEYASDGRHDRTTLAVHSPQPDTGFDVPAGDFRVVMLRLEEPLQATGGVVALRLTTPETNAIMFRWAGSPVPVATALPPPPGPPAATSTPPPAGRSWFAGKHLDLTNDLEAMRRHISAHEPIYFAVGSRERLNARFQFSFKFRLFADRGDDPLEPWWRKRVRELHFAYTQTSIWDLESFSKPFYDSSYKPTLFLLQRLPSPHPEVQIPLQSGGQHESNGKGGGSAPVVPSGGLISATNRARHPLDTRSFNTLYVMPRVRWESPDGGFIEGAARLSGYFQHDENDDIESYRGNVELTLRGGIDRGLQLAMHLRGRPGRHGSVEFNLTWPANRTFLLRDFAPSLGGYAQIQYFNGYGESLLDYDVRRRDQLRFGLMIVR